MASSSVASTMDAPEYIVSTIKDPDMFATIERRQPVIMRKSADLFLSTYKQFLKHKQLTDQQLLEADEEAKRVHEEIYKFAERPPKNEVLERIADDLPDIHLWNLRLEEYLKQHDGRQPTYLDAPLLWTECVFYRTLASIFHRSTYFKEFDAFEEIKRGGLLDAKTAATKLIEVTAGIADRIQSGKSTCEEEFENFLQFAVWGNCFDLSCTTFSCASTDDYHLVDEEKKSRVVANSTKEILKYFQTLPNKTTEITFVLDNSGLELLGDLCFVEMLYQTRLISEESKVIFHHKMFPWFVSDVIREDFTWTLNEFQNEFQSEVVQRMGRRWNDLLNRQKVWELRTHPFWTSPYPFYEMARLSPDLYTELGKSDLVIFCGDLNYRKLISDRVWEHTTPFERTLNGFRPTNIVSLRVVKCRPICGLDENVKLRDKYWLPAQGKKKKRKDNYIAVIHFCPKQ